MAGSAAWLNFFIVFQMDFYFSDVNLNHDRFLRKEVDRDPDGCKYSILIKSDIFKYDHVC